MPPRPPPMPPHTASSPLLLPTLLQMPYLWAWDAAWGTLGCLELGAPPSSSLGPGEGESGSLSPTGRDTEILELWRDGGWEPTEA
jgi:hypothetical protein